MRVPALERLPRPTPMRMVGKRLPTRSWAAPDAANFSIGGAFNDELILTDGVLDFETKSSYTVTVRVTDSGGLTHDESITVNVNDLNDAPTAITPTSFAINENTDTTSGTSVGTLTTTDPKIRAKHSLIRSWAAQTRPTSASVGASQ